MKNASGFTLMEMSIVLVIIGLITGGVLIGNELIGAAELRKMVTQRDQISTAVNTFKLKYNCKPGDCAYATNFFGTDPEGCGVMAFDKTPKTETCNGNGNDVIGYQPSGDAMQESFTFWQQLAAANLIGGVYRGYYLAGSWEDPTLSMPSIRNKYWYTSNGWSLNGAALPQGADQFQMINNTLGLGVLFPPVDVMSVDGKVDDGQPGKGRFQALNATYSAADCFVDPGASQVELDATNNGKLCQVIFLAAY